MQDIYGVEEKKGMEKLDGVEVIKNKNKRL